MLLDYYTTLVSTPLARRKIKCPLFFLPGHIFTDTRSNWVLSVAIGNSSSYRLYSAYGTLDILPRKGDPSKLSHVPSITANDCAYVGSGGCLGHVQWRVTPGTR